MSDLRQPVARFPRDAGWLVAIGLTGAAVRLVYAWQYTDQPLGQYPWVDESSYWSWAQAILRGGWWPVRPFYQDPLYPYWLACLMAVVGTDVAGLRMASAGLGALTPLVVFWAGRTGLGRSEGLLAGWATAVYGPLIFADGCLEKEALAAFCTALALGLCACVSHSGRLALAGAAGAAWGVVGLLRSNALLIGTAGGGLAAPGNERAETAKWQARFTPCARVFGRLFSRRLTGRGRQHRRVESARAARNHLAIGAEFLYRQRSRSDGHVHGPAVCSRSSGL